MISLLFVRIPSAVRTWWYRRHMLYVSASCLRDLKVLESADVARRGY